MPIISHFSCIYPPPKRTKIRKNKGILYIYPLFSCTFFTRFCDTIKNILWHHWWHHCKNAPFRAFKNGGCTTSVFMSFSSRFSSVSMWSAPVLSRFCPGLGRTRFDPVELLLFLRFSCIFSMSCIDIAHEKSGRFWAASVAFLGASRRIIPNFLPRLWNLRFYSYLWVSEIRFSFWKNRRNSRKFTRSFFRLFSNLLNIKSRSDTVTPVCYENYGIPNFNS